MMCLSIGTSNNYHFPSDTHWKVAVFGVPKLKHFRVSQTHDFYSFIMQRMQGEILTQVCCLYFLAIFPILTPFKILRWIHKLFSAIEFMLQFFDLWICRSFTISMIQFVNSFLEMLFISLVLFCCKEENECVNQCLFYLASENQDYCWIRKSVKCSADILQFCWGHLCCFRCALIKY